MSIYSKELKGYLKPFLIWTGVIVFMLVVCIVMFPEMKSQMESVQNMFADMGDFTAAFGMDQINFGTIMGFYGVECGNIIGLGATFFAAFLGISILSKEEKDHTAEFLLTHPVSRVRIMVEKLMAVITQLVVLNVLVAAISFISITLIGEDLQVKEFLLLHTGLFLLQFEVAMIAFGLSAFVRRGSVGIGIGFAAIMYFLNIIRNISDQAEFLKYITPFSYAEAADIITYGKLNGLLILLGMVYGVIAIAVGFFKYRRKDIAA